MTGLQWKLGSWLVGLGRKAHLVGAECLWSPTATPKMVVKWSALEVAQTHYGHSPGFLAGCSVIWHCCRPGLKERD
jgi:hypothetical protein